MDANDPSAFCLSHPMANGRIFLVGMSLLRKQKFLSWQTPIPGLLLKVSWTIHQRVLGVCPTDPGFPHLEALLSWYAGNSNPQLQWVLNCECSWISASEPVQIRHREADAPSRKVAWVRPFPETPCPWAEWKELKPRSSWPPCCGLGWAHPSHSNSVLPSPSQSLRSHHSSLGSKEDSSRAWEH